MNMKGVFAAQSAWFQLGLLLSAILLGTLLANLIGLIPMAFMDKGIYESPGMMRLFQFISSILSFLLPSLFVAYVCSTQPAEYLSIKAIPSLKAWLLTFVSMFLFSPTITLTGLLNKAVRLPDFMRPVEQWMQSLEAMAEEVTQKLLSESDPVSLLLNLLVIAVTAAVTEEFLFRGSIQRIIEKWTGNHHLVIWGAAFVFTIAHFQFYGLLPRLLLGAYFGYLLYWSKSIWLPIFAHFVNNAVAVVGMSSESLKDTIYVSGDIPNTEIVNFLIPAILTFILFCLCVRAIKLAHVSYQT